MQECRAYLAYLMQLNNMDEKYADALSAQVDGYLRNMSAIRESGKFDDTEPIFSHAQLKNVE